MADADVKEIRESFEEDDADWSPIREARNSDVKALGPDSTWDDTDRRTRKDAGRPCLSFDELGQYVNQLVNDARETKRAIEVSPRNDEASEDDARFVADWIRQVEYRSRAQMAYTQMFDDAVSGSYGFLRIVPRYLQQKIAEPSARSFDQELLIQPVHNPNLITPGYFTRPDMSDAQRFWVHESYTHEQFKREFPDAEIRDFHGAELSVGPRWVDSKRVWVRELWKLKTRRKKLALLPPPIEGAEPMAVWVETIPEQARKETLATALSVRVVDEPYVCQIITNGMEILEEKTDWKGQFLPIIGCVGRVIWTEEERYILSLIRKAIDPQQLYNYYRTGEAEIVGMTPKVPHFGYKGALDAKNKAALVAANQVPVGLIEVTPNPEGWNPAWGPPPLPSRTAFEPPIQAFEQGAESTRRSIQSATGTGFLPTEAQRQNQKSGIALREITSSAQKGAYHFVDNFEHALFRVAEVLVDLMPHYLDTARDVQVRGNDDTTRRVRINDAKAPASKEYGGKPILLTPTQEYDITIGTGPSYDTERDKASEFADQLVTARPEIFQLIGPEVIKLKNLGPIGDRIVEILEAMQPPQIQQLRQGNQPLPPQAQQAMAQLQQAQQMIQQLQRTIETEQVKGQTQLQLKELDGQIRLALAELQGKQKLQQLSATVAADIDTREDDQAHELAMAGADASQAAEQAHRAMMQAARDGSTAHLKGRPPMSSDGR